MFKNKSVANCIFIFLLLFGICRGVKKFFIQRYYMLPSFKSTFWVSKQFSKLQCNIYIKF